MNYVPAEEARKLVEENKQLKAMLRTFYFHHKKTMEAIGVQDDRLHTVCFVCREYVESIGKEQQNELQ